MAKYKYSPEMSREIRRIVKNFNEKRLRDIKKRGIAKAPDKRFVSQIKEQYSDKPIAALKRELKLLESYNKGRQRSLEFYSPDSRLSKWEYNYIREKLPSTKAYYTREIEEMENIIGKDQQQFVFTTNDRLNTLKAQRNKLNQDLATLSDDDIRGIRRYIEKSEMSTVTKAKGFRAFMSEVDTIMEFLGFSKARRDEFFNKFSVLTPNEFFQMYNSNELIGRIYELYLGSDSKGDIRLNTDADSATEIVEMLLSDVDNIVAEAKKS